MKAMYFGFGTSTTYTGQQRHLASDRDAHPVHVAGQVPTIRALCGTNFIEEGMVDISADRPGGTVREAGKAPGPWCNSCLGMAGWR